MAHKKVRDISYFDLKETCKIFNQHEHILGTRIIIHRKGFDDLMDAFIKAVLAVPIDRKEDVPADVIAFFNTLSMERFEALHAAAPTPAEVVVYRNDGISEFEPKACGMLEGWTTVADMSIGNLPPSKEGLPRSFPMQEGQIKIKTTIGLTELVQRLEELVAALKNGRIVIESRNRMIMMKPDDPVKIKIAADVQNGKKNRQEQMTIKLEWLRIAAGDRNVNDYGAYRL